MAVRWAEFPELGQKRKFALGGGPGLVKSRGAPGCSSHKQVCPEQSVLTARVGMFGKQFVWQT